MPLVPTTALGGKVCVQVTVAAEPPQLTIQESFTRPWVHPRVRGGRGSADLGLQVSGP